MSQVEPVAADANIRPLDVVKASVPDVIDVAFGVDAAFVPHMAACIASAVACAPRARFRFIIMHDGVAADQRAAVESISPASAFCWIEVSDDDLPEFKAREHYTRAILYRLGLEKMAPADCTRLIYLDSDTIVTGDLGVLWRMDLEGAPLGAVVDTFTDAADFAPRWNLEVGDNLYFNSGVLLIDLARVRDEQLFTAAIKFVAQHDEAVRFSDQDALNWVSWSRWKNIGNEWNAQRDMAVRWVAHWLPDHKQLKGARPGVVHFTSALKPWLPGIYHPWSWIYWRALKRTPFYKDVLRRYGATPLDRGRAWVRWLRRRPRGMK